LISDKKSPAEKPGILIAYQTACAAKIFHFRADTYLQMKIYRSKCYKAKIYSCLLLFLSNEYLPGNMSQLQDAEE